MSKATEIHTHEEKQTVDFAQSHTHMLYKINDSRKPKQITNQAIKSNQRAQTLTVITNHVKWTDKAKNAQKKGKGRKTYKTM